MNLWAERSLEERNLLNPAFCAVLLWHAAHGYATERSTSMAIEVSFLVLPFVLHRETREDLPSSIRTSLPTWLAGHPIVRTRLGDRASMLCAFTKEALTFGGCHGLLSLAQGGVRANVDMRQRVNAFLKTASHEVRECAKRAEFLGRWFDNAGTPETVMTLLGVCP